MATSERAVGSALHSLANRTVLFQVGENIFVTFGLFAAAQRSGALDLRGVFSHLSNTSPEDDRRQLVAFERFLDAVRSVGLEPGIRHLAASAAALDHPAARYDMVRYGIALYGIAPERHQRGALPFGPAADADQFHCGDKKRVVGQ